MLHKLREMGRRNAIAVFLWGHIRWYMSPASLRQIAARIQQFPLSELLLDYYLAIRVFLQKNKKGISTIPCLVPFTRLEFGVSGNVTTCCPAYTKVTSIGNIKKSTIEQTWNGRRIRIFRKRLLLGDTQKTCKPNCSFLAHPPISVEDIRKDTKEARSLYDDIRRGRSKSRSHPLWFSLSNHSTCNLNCIMCGRDPSASSPDHVRLTHENLAKYFDQKITICLTGDGDVLARRDTRELLQSFDSKRYNQVTFELLTNGLLFNSRTWKGIKHNNYTWANISIDAATKETYERIRRGGNWEKLMDALELFKGAKEEGIFSNVTINMTVMRSNFKEIPLLVEMARARGFTAFFSMIIGQWGDENFFELNDGDTLQELKTVLSNSLLYGDDVDLTQLSEYVPDRFKTRMYNHLTAMAYESLLERTLHNGWTHLG
jgi:hypothetical protein